ncbi:NADH-quinone oxidoreductase subunit NuoF [Candidatus Legionella polyplacis]|uniref:NADH-quinone oxidoreductase subunit NuoF n=1 Tax=Candidatus Legionella polyplacis TaxID=2005262 RepID=UPI001F2CABDD|nr:NADH-quinone oxidoreductase subunit NuoF [Candidatus Legionella polyplacis]
MMKLNQVCYRTLHLKKSWTLSAYQSVGGYSALKYIIRTNMSPEEIIKEIKISSLRGRGGAGFPTYVKWDAIDRTQNEDKYVVCNSDEGEPGTCKDRYILTYNPHQLIEGMIIAGYTIGAKIGYNYIRGEFWLPFKRMEEAIKEAYIFGFLGKNILNSNINFDLYNHLGAGSYICGEETALLNSLEGKIGQPRFKPPLPAKFGLYGKPTLINNTETLASIPLIVEKGGEWFLNIGKPPNNGGTKCFSVTGHVNRPGNYEVSLGTPFRSVLSLAGGVYGGNKIKAVIPGGTSMKVVLGEIMMDLDLDFDSLRDIGSGLGSGAIIVMNENTCMVNALYCITKFYMEESCGQCTPCREGVGWMFRLVRKIKYGLGNLNDIDTLINIANNIEGKTICAFGDAASWPVQSFIKNFYDEFECFIKKKIFF